MSHGSIGIHYGPLRSTMVQWGEMQNALHLVLSTSASVVASARRSQLWKALLILSTEHGKTFSEASTVSEILGLPLSARQTLGDQGLA